LPNTYHLSLSPTPSLHPSTQARVQVQNLFRKNSHVGDPVIVDMLVKKGYMELEETLMQWKQKTHLLRLLAADTETPRKYKNKKTFTEKFLSNTMNPDD
jgi:NADH dehydrogenase (ubiquinone) 1 alpha subcomplex subunit 6